jgi:DNA polymerase III subunit epsilon
VGAARADLFLIKSVIKSKRQGRGRQAADPTGPTHVSYEYERLERRFRFPKLCTCAGMRRRYPGHQSYSLGNLCETYGIDLKEHHRALCDARAAAQLLNLINQQRDIRPETSGVAA